MITGAGAGAGLIASLWVNKYTRAGTGMNKSINENGSLIRIKCVIVRAGVRVGNGEDTGTGAGVTVAGM